MHIDIIKRELLNFPWHDYSLDEVEEASSNEWADHLAARIAEALPAES